MALRRADVVEQALALLDEVGFPDLTMRRLATALGVQPGALYWHFDSKQSLLAAVAEEILAQAAPLPPAAAPWPERLAVWADGLRAALCRYRDGAEVVASVLAMRTAQVDPARQGERILTEAGMSASAARVAAVNLLHFVLGHSVDAQGHAFMVQFGVADRQDEQRPSDVFAAGLAVWVAGLRATLASGPSAEPSAGPPASGGVRPEPPRQ